MILNPSKGGENTSDATGTAADLLAPKTMYGPDGKVTGTIPSKAAQTYTPGTADQTIAAGQYLSGAQTIAGDADLVAGNIKKDVQIFGVTGTYEGAAEPVLVPLSVTDNGTYVPGTGVDGYDSVTVNVSGNITVEALDVTQNGTTTAPSGKAYSPVTVAVPEPTGTINITENGVVNVKDYASANVAVSGGGGSDDLDKFAQGTLSAAVLGTATSLRSYAAYQNTGLTSFTASEATSVGSYAFQGCTNLASVSLPKVTTINSYSFQNLANLASVNIPLANNIYTYAFYNVQKGTFTNNELTAYYIDSYALQNFGKTASTGFAWRPRSSATVGSYAFAGSKLTSISGTVASIGTYAFDGCGDLSSADFSTYTSSNSPGQYAFRGAGKTRADTTTPLYLNFGNASFTSVQTYCFSQLENTVITLPSTVTSIAASAFDSIRDSAVIITGNLPSLASTNVFNGMSNSYAAVPYNTINAAKQATNWNSIADYIIGYAPAGTFTAGDALPTTNSENIDIYWTTDPFGKNWVTECPSGSPALYAQVGTKTGMWVDNDVNGGTISVVGSDSTVYPFVDGRATLPRGTTFSITATYPSGYEISVTLNGAEVSSFPISNLTADQDYVLAGRIYDPTAQHTYGVSWDGTSTTVWTRTDDAASFEEPVPYVAGATNYGSPFDTCAPWSGMEIVEDSEAGTMVKIPKFWYKIEQSGAGMSIKISDAAQDGFSVCPACMDRGDGRGEREYALVGRYHCGSTAYKSATGQTPKAGVAQSSFRQACHNLGSTVWMMDFATRFTIWMLYLVEYANWNSQATIGYGCGNSGQSAGLAMGYTDSMPYHTGTTQSSRTTYGLGTQYRHIEGLWDNVYDRLTGCYYNSSGMNITLNPANFAENSGGTLIGMPSSGYPSAFTAVDASGTFPMFYASAASGGSETTYSCDYWNYDSSYPVIYVGGSWGQDGSHGLFYVDYTHTSGASAYLGSRLLKLP